MLAGPHWWTTFARDSSHGRADPIRVLICCEPCDPPVTYTVGSARWKPYNPSACTALSARPDRISGRTGLPVTTAVVRADSGSSGTVDADDTATRDAPRTSTLLARPSRTVCSCTTNGRRHSIAPKPTGM